LNYIVPLLPTATTDKILLPNDHDMKKTTTALFALFTTISLSQAQNFIQKGIDIDAEAAGDESGWSVSMPDANTIAIGAYQNDGIANNAGHVRIYTWDLSNGGSWLQKGNDIDGEAAEDRSGWSVDMPDANTVAIGAYLNDGSGINSGHVRVYVWDPSNGGAWIQKGIDIDGEEADDRSGWSVSMPDANTIAIGAYQNGGNGNDAGHVRVYSWSGSAWLQLGGDLDGEAPSDQSGQSVSMPDANTVAIGANRSDGNGNNAGHVRIYTWSSENGGSWMQKGTDIDGETADDYSGYSVNMPDANTVAIGAWGNDVNGINSGHVRIYTWNNNAWTQQGADIDGQSANQESGYSVSMPDNNTVAVGAYRDNGNGLEAGHVRIYSWNGNTWAQLTADIEGEEAGDQAGCSVSMPDANTIAIGARYNGENGSNAGHARVFFVGESVNVLEDHFGDDITVYPNPTKDLLYINTGNIYNNLNVTISNPMGQIMMQKCYSESSLLKVNLPSQMGIYFIELQSGEMKTQFKVLKQ
jgi:hypothetical protein